MQVITAGPAPWSEQKGFVGILKRGVSKNSFSNAQRTLGGGNGTMSAPTKEIAGPLTGDKYKVLRDYQMPFSDLRELNKFLRSAEKNIRQGVSTGEVPNELSDHYKSILSKNGELKRVLKDVRTPGDYIDFGFSEKQQENITSVDCQGGHIKSIAYNPGYKLMKVLFSNNGSEVVFFNLPANVAATLMYLGANGTMAPPDKNGRERHAVGVEFWNLVRIRGTLHGTRYQFAYTVDNRIGYYDYSSSPGGTPVEKGDGGSLSQKEQKTIATQTQVSKPNTPVTDVPEPAKFPSYAIDAYSKADFDRILGENGIYKPWYDDMKHNWQASGSSYMLKLADQAEKAYGRGNLSQASEAFKDLSRSGVKFPDAMENDEDFDFSESTGYGAN